jgi:type I restriction enzyme S subunit
MNDISKWLETHYPKTEKGLAAIKHIDALWKIFEPFADTNFQAEFQSNEPGKFQQRYWEMHLGCWLLNKGFKLLAHKSEGPDIAIQLPDRKLFIEAIAPGPGSGPDKVPDITPQPWKPGEKLEVREVPSKQIILRWTAAFHVKAQCIQKYHEAGIITPKDSCIIAINSCQLGAFGFDGISTFPAAVEAVYPIGPQQVHFTIGQPEKTTSDLQYRPEVEKLNKSTVTTTPFMGKNFSYVSAILAAHRNELFMYCQPEQSLVLVHNQHAAAPIIRKELPVDIEYWVEPIDSGIRIRQDPERSI